METPNNKAGRVTEEIMGGIRDHIKPGGLNPGEVAHYNRAFEHVYKVLSQHLVDVPQPSPFGPLSTQRTQRICPACGWGTCICPA